MSALRVSRSTPQPTRTRHSVVVDPDIESFPEAPKLFRLLCGFAFGTTLTGDVYLAHQLSVVYALTLRAFRNPTADVRCCCYWSVVIGAVGVGVYQPVCLYL